MIWAVHCWKLSNIIWGVLYFSTTMYTECSLFGYGPNSGCIMVKLVKIEKFCHHRYNHSFFLKGSYSHSWFDEYHESWHFSFFELCFKINQKIDLNASPVFREKSKYCQNPSFYMVAMGIDKFSNSFWNFSDLNFQQQTK